MHSRACILMRFHGLRKTIRMYISASGLLGLLAHEPMTGFSSRTLSSINCFYYIARSSHPNTLQLPGFPYENMPSDESRKACSPLQMSLFCQMCACTHYEHEACRQSVGKVYIRKVMSRSPLFQLPKASLIRCKADKHIVPAEKPPTC